MEKEIEQGMAKIANILASILTLSVAGGLIYVGNKIKKWLKKRIAENAADTLNLPSPPTHAVSVQTPDFTSTPEYSQIGNAPRRPRMHRGGARPRTTGLYANAETYPSFISRIPVPKKLFGDTILEMKDSTPQVSMQDTGAQVSMDETESIELSTDQSLTK